MNNSVLMILAVAIPVVFLLIFIFSVLTSSGKKEMSKMVNDVNDVINENEDTLKNISTKSANISKDGIEIAAKAIKDGITKK